MLVGQTPNLQTYPTHQELISIWNCDMWDMQKLPFNWKAEIVTEKLLVVINFVIISPQHIRGWFIWAWQFYSQTIQDEIHNNL